MLNKANTWRIGEGMKIIVPAKKLLCGTLLHRPLILFSSLVNFLHSLVYLFYRGTMLLSEL
jgi:hypothetical protein